MSEGPVVLARLLSKRFKIYNNSADRLSDWLGLPGGPKFREFWALRDVSFELHRGDCLGIIGPNGAGKSTLLKLLTGVLRPTAGSVEMRGRVLSLLELGSDFSPELTGRQNVVESVRLLGLPRSFGVHRMDDIEAFAELGDYFDRPVKTYSSGMFVRLAFSLFSALEPEIFLVDEALTVGDLRFSAKALARIRDMRQRGTTLLFVSHNLEIVSQLCDRVIWVHAGQVQMDGDAHEVTSAYVQFMINGAAELPGAPTPSTTQTAPDTLPAEDDKDAGSMWLGPGWHQLEAYGGEVFRWADAVAEIVLDRPPRGGALQLEIEPVFSGQNGPLALSIDNGIGPPAQITLAGREVVYLSCADNSGQPQKIQISAPEGAHALPGDGRSVAFRALRWGWSAEHLRSIDTARIWHGEGSDPDLEHEVRALRRTLATYLPVPHAKARIVDVVTRNTETGASATRFITHGEMTLEIEVEAIQEVPMLVVGIEIKDAFGRGLYRTRNCDQHPRETIRVRQGERILLQFHCPRILLGQGVYHFVLGVGGEGLENEIWHLVDRAWSFQVLNRPEMPLYGVVDLDWRFAPVLAESRR